MQDLTKKISDLLDQIRGAIDKLDLSQDEIAIAQLVEKTQDPNFWNDPQKAAEITQKISGLRRHAESWRALEADTADLLELSRLAEPSDEAYITHIQTTYDKLAADFGARQFELMMSGPHDRADAIVEIHAGTGGTDAQDWAQMLERMYLRWAEARGYNVEILAESSGEEAGIKSVTVQITGPYAYGRLRGEAGTHRLVRLSPFNADNLRQTSFALVEVLPVLDQSAELEIDPKDLRVDVYRSSGNGGQSVNTTDSAVRITHLPTGIVVTCQNERSQLQNREKAIQMLKSQLYEIELRKKKEAQAEIEGNKKKIEWGSQIRNYVLHPYKLVKDIRTGHETSNAFEVLDGDLNDFIKSYLMEFGRSDSN